MSTAPPVLGVDVGGTNTDAVIMLGDEVIAAAKRSTTVDVGDGLIAAVRAVLEAAEMSPQSLATVMIGTTQFINAFVQRRELTQVAAVRVALPKTDGIPPMVGWPEDLAQVVGRHGYLVGGGSFYDGREYAPLDTAALENAGRDIRAKGIRAIALTSGFAPVRPDIEHKAAEVLLSIHPEADITLSSEVGGLGLIDRENAALINASLRQLSRRVVTSLREALGQLGVRAPIYFSQNDGTLVSTAYATRFPIVTCSAGPTNSIRGAAFLTGLQDAIVMDIGGTTTDLGFLVRGFPRETATAHLIGGVRTNFRMPDVLSIALGGGTRVRGDAANVVLGPDSVGFELTRRHDGIIITAKHLGGETHVVAFDPHQVVYPPPQGAELGNAPTPRSEGTNSLPPPDRATIEPEAVAKPAEPPKPIARAEKVAAESPDMLVQLPGSDRNVTVAEALKQAKEQHALELTENDLVKAALECALGYGG